MVDVSGLNDAVLKALSTVHNFGKDIPHLGHYYSVATDFAYDNLHYYVIECAVRPLANRAPDWVSDNRVFNVISSHKGIAVLVAGVGLVIFIIYKLHPTKPSQPPEANKEGTAPRRPLQKTRSNSALNRNSMHYTGTPSRPRASSLVILPDQSDPLAAPNRAGLFAELREFHAAHPNRSGNGATAEQSADKLLSPRDGKGNSGATGDASHDAPEDDNGDQVVTTPINSRRAQTDVLAALSTEASSNIPVTPASSDSAASDGREMLTQSQVLKQMETTLDAFLANTETSAPSASVEHETNLDNLLLKQPTPAEMPAPRTFANLGHLPVATYSSAAPRYQSVDFEANGAGGATLTSERDSAEGSSSESALSPLAGRTGSQEEVDNETTSSTRSTSAKGQPAEAPSQPRLTRNGKPYIEGWKRMTKAEKKAALKAAQAQSPQTTPAKKDPK